MMIAWDAQSRSVTRENISLCLVPEEHVFQHFVEESHQVPLEGEAGVP